MRKVAGAALLVISCDWDQMLWCERTSPGAREGEGPNQDTGGGSGRVSSMVDSSAPLQPQYAGRSAEQLQSCLVTGSQIEPVLAPPAGQRLHPPTAGARVALEVRAPFPGEVKKGPSPTKRCPPRRRCRGGRCW